jgi:hypothetical protein
MHSVLVPGVPTEDFELISNVNSFFKIQVKDLPAPISIKVEYEKMAGENEVYFTTSILNKYPDEHDHLTIKKNPKLITITYKRNIFDI